MQNISETVRQLRKQKGWTQRQLAGFANLDRTTVGALERNDYADIGIRKVERILSLLGKRLTVVNAGLPTLDDLREQR